MKPEYTAVHFCEQCYRDFRTLIAAPDRCSKCGSKAWNKPKKFRQEAGEVYTDWQDS